MNKFLIVFLLLIVPLFSIAQNSEDSLRILDLKKVYKTSDTISFFFKNESKRQISVKISIEKRLKNKWVPCLLDIFQQEGSFKVTTVLDFNGLENRREDWPVRKFMRKNEFRFVFYIVDNSAKCKAIKYSNIISVYP